MLLELIDTHGSLKKAAEEMGMSYRTAWGKIKKSEKVLGALLIERVGSRRGGYRLSDFGRELTKGYKAWLEATQLDARRQAEEIFQRSFRTYCASDAPS